ncbi:MAG: hypothetical protein LC802_02660 [Acidobacteria bacterium]|nr:hypothetical protein [Acidobacteriota bacterium]
MSMESKDDFVTVIDERIRRISREVTEEMLGIARQPAELLVKDVEALNIRESLQRIMVKEFISIKEAHLLLGCSDGHIRNLVDKARKKKTSHPIPFARCCPTGARGGTLRVASFDRDPGERSR